MSKGMIIEIKGLDKLHDRLKKLADPAPIKTVVKKNGADLKRRMIDEAHFKRFGGDYSTGATRGSIIMNISFDGMSAKVGPTTEYSPYLEFGTRFMLAQPFATPAANAIIPKFIRDLEMLVRNG